MEIILVPGLWLNASTWDAVVPLLEQGGHRATALTLPGMESVAADRAGITVEDHVAAVVEALGPPGGDAGAPVLLVGHSAGCGIAHAALDRRPERVARVVHVGGFPGGDGEPLLSGLPAVDGEVAMPDWKQVGEEASVVDLTDEQLEQFYAAAVPVPERVVTDPVRLGDERRHDVPATLVCPEYTADEVREWVAAGHLPEVEAARSVEYVDLPGGHWPQLTRPEALAAVLLAEAGRAAP